MKKLIKSCLFVVIASFFLISSANAISPSDFDLSDGDLISAIFSDDPDVYIVNKHGFKRLFLNPEIFKFYGHLGGFANVKLVTPEIRDAFPTTGLFRNCENDDPKVYGIDIEDEDAGKLRWVDTSGEQAIADDPDFFKKVFCINKKEFDWYPKGQLFKSVSEVSQYSRNDNVAICHYPPDNPTNFHTLRVASASFDTHLGHGDTKGACATPTPITTFTPIPTASPSQPLTTPMFSPIASPSISPVATSSFTPTPTSVSQPTATSTPLVAITPTPSVTSTPIPTATPDVAIPSISLNYPNGGETFILGNTHLITWTSTNFPAGTRMGIFLQSPVIGGFDDSIPITTDWVLDTGGYNKFYWTLPSANYYEGSQFTVKVLNYAQTDDPLLSQSYYDESDNYFSIVSSAPVFTPTPTPSPPADYCGDGICNGSEDWHLSSCPDDCPIPSCIDSDGGRDYYVKGSIPDSPNPWTDFCSNSTTLRETYCNPNVASVLGVTLENYTCPNGCQDGACIAVTSDNFIVKLFGTVFKIFSK